MIEQITSSIKFDIYEPTRPEEISAERWFADEQESAASNLKHHTEALEKEQTATKSRVAWLEQLMASLPVEEVTAV